MLVLARPAVGTRLVLTPVLRRPTFAPARWYTAPMRCWLLLLCLPAFACARAVPDPRFPALDLPRVGTIGWHARDLPAPVVVVNLHRDGRVSIDGQVVPVRELVRRFEPIAATRRDLAHPNQPSEAYLVVRCDRDVPWGAVQQVMRAASDPVNRMNRLLFGVLPEVGGEEGTLALYLPLDRCLCDHGDLHPPDALVRVGLAPGDGPAVTPANLAAALGAVGGIRCVSLACRPGVCVGDLLSVADALLRAKVTLIELGGFPSPGSSLAIPTGSASGSGLAIRVPGLEIPSSGPVCLPPAVRLAGVAGSAGNYEQWEEPPFGEHGPGEDVDPDDLPIEESLDPLK